MSTGGTGDVLTGIIASFIGHGDRVANVKGEHGLVAGDLAEEIPYAIKSLI